MVTMECHSAFWPKHRYHVIEGLCIVLFGPGVMPESWVGFAQSNVSQLSVYLTQSHAFRSVIVLEIYFYW